MDGMERRKPSSAGIVVVAVLLALAVLSALYLASVGPALYYDRTMNEGNTPQWIIVVYAPLFRLAAQSEIVDQALDAYLTFWGVLD